MDPDVVWALYEELLTHPRVVSSEEWEWIASISSTKKVSVGCWIKLNIGYEYTYWSRLADGNYRLDHIVEERYESTVDPQEAKAYGIVESFKEDPTCWTSKRQWNCLRAAAEALEWNRERTRRTLLLSDGSVTEWEPTPTWVNGEQSRKYRLVAFHD